MLEKKILDTLCEQVDFKYGRGLTIDPDNILRYFHIEKDKTDIYRDFIIFYSRIDHPDTNFLFYTYPNQDLNKLRIFTNSFIGGTIGILAYDPLFTLIGAFAAGALTYYDEKRYNLMNMENIYKPTLAGTVSGMLIDMFYNFPGYCTNIFMGISFIYSANKENNRSQKSITDKILGSVEKTFAKVEFKRRRYIKRNNLYRFTLESLEEVK